MNPQNQPEIAPLLYKSKGFFFVASNNKQNLKCLASI